MARRRRPTSTTPDRKTVARAFARWILRDLERELGPVETWRLVGPIAVVPPRVNGGRRKRSARGR